MQMKTFDLALSGQYSTVSPRRSVLQLKMSHFFYKKVLVEEPEPANRLSVEFSMS